jgi:hypothetical protein
LPPHKSSIRCPVETIRLGSIATTASTARCIGPPMASSRPVLRTRTGPRRRTQRLGSHLRRPAQLRRAPGRADPGHLVPGPGPPAVRPRRRVYPRLGELCAAWPAAASRPRSGQLRLFRASPADQFLGQLLPPRITRCRLAAGMARARGLQLPGFPAQSPMTSCEPCWPELASGLHRPRRRSHTKFLTVPRRTYDPTSAGRIPCLDLGHEALASAITTVRVR